jgi:hypothetical protein
MLNWIVNEKKIAPHIPVIDKSKREDATFSRNIYLCPGGGKVLTPDHALRYQASLPDLSISDVKLIASPPSGQVVIKGPAFSYTAKPDFQGQDDFALQVSGTMVRIPGVSDIKVTVSVVAK